MSMARAITARKPRPSRLGRTGRLASLVFRGHARSRSRDTCCAPRSLRSLRCLLRRPSPRRSPLSVPPQLRHRTTHLPSRLLQSSSERAELSRDHERPRSGLSDDFAPSVVHRWTRSAHGYAVRFRGSRSARTAHRSSIEPSFATLTRTSHGNRAVLADTRDAARQVGVGARRQAVSRSERRDSARGMSIAANGVSEKRSRLGRLVVRLRCGAWWIERARAARGRRATQARERSERAQRAHRPEQAEGFQMSLVTTLTPVKQSKGS
jgi:hypothetical protein